MNDLLTVALVVGIPSTLLVLYVALLIKFYPHLFK